MSVRPAGQTGVELEQLKSPMFFSPEPATRVRRSLLRFHPTWNQLPRSKPVGPDRSTGKGCIEDSRGQPLGLCLRDPHVVVVRILKLSFPQRNRR